MLKRNKKISVKHDHTDALYLAVQHYVESKGGKLLVIGGVQVQQWPGDRPFNFTLGIRCTGRKPVFTKGPA